MSAPALKIAAGIDRRDQAPLPRPRARSPSTTASIPFVVTHRQSQIAKTAAVQPDHPFHHHTVDRPGRERGRFADRQPLP